MPNNKNQKRHSGALEFRLFGLHHPLSRLRLGSQQINGAESANKTAPHTPFPPLRQFAQ
jgi:hypothetical protein